MYPVNIEVLLNQLHQPTKWFKRENIDKKIKIIYQLQEEGHLYIVPAVFSFLQHQNHEIKAAVMSLVRTIFHKNQDNINHNSCLKYCEIKVQDFNIFKKYYKEDDYKILLATASLNYNGFVRETALKEIQSYKDDFFLTYILFRLNDWVIPVQHLATKVFQSYLSPDSIPTFLSKSNLIEWLKKVHRNDLSDILNQVTDFLYIKHQDTVLTYLPQLHNKQKLIVATELAHHNTFHPRLIAVFMSEKDMLIRGLVAKNIAKIEQLSPLLIEQLLKDKASSIRLKTLFSLDKLNLLTKKQLINYLTDTHALVRQYARFELQKQLQLNFAEYYRSEMSKKEQLKGCILGLSDVGEVSDALLILPFVSHTEIAIQKASISAILKLKPTLLENYLLDHLNSEISWLRKQAITYLSEQNFSIAITKARNIFDTSSPKVQRDLLRFFHQISNYKILGDLIKAVGSPHLEVRQVGWNYLQSWKDTSTTRFIKPNNKDILWAREQYAILSKNYLQFTEHQQKLWKELPHIGQFD